MSSLAKTAEENKISKTALITVGNFLGDDYSLSKLYDKNFETEIKSAAELIDDEAEIHLIIKNNDGTNYNLFDTEYEIYLENNGVQTNIHYPVAPHKQECYKKWNKICLPVTELIHEQELSLPMSPMLTMNEAMEVVKIINAFE